MAFTSPVVVVKARVGANPVPGTSSKTFDCDLSETAPVELAAVTTRKVNSTVAPFVRPVINLVVVSPLTVAEVPELISTN